MSELCLMASVTGIKLEVLELAGSLLDDDMLTKEEAALRLKDVIKKLHAVEDVIINLAEEQLKGTPVV